MRRGTRDPWRGRSPGAESMLSMMAQDGLTSLAIVGLAKNAGKTTTLGALLEAAARRGTRVGLTSIGRDGEARDLITGETKPRIRLVRGSLVATAESCGTRLELLERTGVTGAMGEIVIARVPETTDVEVAGPPTRDGLKEVLPRLVAHGAALAIVDGAFDRRASACPLVTDATVLAAGMALSPAIDEVVAEARHVVRLLTLPAAPASPAREVAGALTETALAKLVAERFAGTLVVADATRVFVEPMTLARFEAAGGALAVRHPIRLLGVTVNPYEPGGRGADPGTLLSRMRDALAPVPVCDVVWEGVA